MGSIPSVAIDIEVDGNINDLSSINLKCSLNWRQQHIEAQVISDSISNT